MKKIRKKTGITCATVKKEKEILKIHENQQLSIANIEYITKLCPNEL